MIIFRMSFFASFLILAVVVIRMLTKQKLPKMTYGISYYVDC